MTKVFSSVYTHFLLLVCVNLYMWGLPGDGYLYFGDVQTTFIFNSEKTYGNFYIWDDALNGGSLNPALHNSYVFNILLVGLSKVLSPYIFSYFYSFMGTFLLALSFYALVFHIFRQHYYALLGSLLLLLSPIVSVYNSAILLVYSLAFINFALIFIVTIVNEEGKCVRFSHIFFPALFLTFANVYLQNHFLLGYVFIVFLLFFNKKVLTPYYLKYYIGIIGIYLLINSQWIYLMLMQMLHDGGVGKLTMSDVALDTVNAISNITNFSTTIRAIPFFWPTGDAPIAYYNWHYLLLGLSFLFIATIFYFLSKIQKNQYIIFSLLLLVIFLPLSYGLKFIFSYIFMFFWDHVPLFTTFRTFIKFLIIVSYVYIFIFLYGLSQRRFRFLEKSLGKLLMVGVALVPLITYDSVSYRKMHQPEIIPNDYPSLYQKFHPSLVSSAFVLPETNWLFTYEWRSDPNKDSANLLPAFTKLPLFVNGAIYTYTSSTEIFNKKMADLFASSQSIEELSQFGNKNIKYLIFCKDVMPFNSFYFEWEKRNITSNLSDLEKRGLVKKIDSSRYIDVYEIDDRFFKHKIYPLREVSLIHYDTKKLSENYVSTMVPQLSSMLENPLDNVMYVEKADHNFSTKVKFRTEYIYPDTQSNVYKELTYKKIQEDSSFIDVDLQNFVLNDHQNIQFKKISPVEYEVLIEYANNDEESSFVFSESFDKNWKLSIGCVTRDDFKTDAYMSQILVGSRQNENLNSSSEYQGLDYTHKVINGNSNVFTINLKSLEKSHKDKVYFQDGKRYIKLKVYYGLQHDFNVLLYGAFLTIFIGFFSSVVSLVRHRNRQGD